MNCDDEFDIRHRSTRQTFKLVNSVIPAVELRDSRKQFYQ